MATEHAMQPRPVAASPRHAPPGQEPGYKPQPLGVLATGLNSAPRVRGLATLQAAMANTPPTGFAQTSNNRTGLPDRLKAGVEAMSGVSLDHVRVHYDSPEPAQLQAHAFARGHDIHLGPGQERHLPHEAWHLVQQAQGRVRPTVQLQGGTLVNDDADLEREATVMGARALGLPEAEDTRAAIAQRAQAVTTAGALVSIDTAPLASGFAQGEVVQGEFAVQVSVGQVVPFRGRRVTDIKFGERPNTQFGSAQEDHVLAWTLKINEIRERVMSASSLRDALAILLTIIDDTNSLLDDPAIAEAGELVRSGWQEDNDDLDRQQALQTGIERFLVAYNANPGTTRKRVGARDRTEGARVRSAKNSIVDHYGQMEDEDISSPGSLSTAINGFVKKLGDTFQLEMKSGELAADRKQGFPKVVQALHATLMSGFNHLAESALSEHLAEIMSRFVERETKALGLSATDRQIVKDGLRSDIRIAAFLE